MLFRSREDLAFVANLTGAQGDSAFVDNLVEESKRLPREDSAFVANLVEETAPLSTERSWAGWYFHAWEKYAAFDGRAPRVEYWIFNLVNFLAGLFLIAILQPGGAVGIGILFYLVALFLPMIAVQVRRLHDTDRSGWNLLLNFIPLIGSIVLLVFFLQRGTQGRNLYGPDPRYE